MTTSLHGPLVASLLYDGLCTFEFGIVAEIFGLYRPEMGPGWYRHVSAAIEPGPLRAHGGFRLIADEGIEVLARADIIVVPGWKGADVAVPDALIRALQAAHARGARLASICSGAFVLAATGLLDGQVATTHWRYAEALARRFPGLEVDAKSLYRQAGRVFTSAGSAAGIDLMLEIVRQDFGPDAANSVARRLVMPAHRRGGQAQFLERPVAQARHHQIAPLLDLIRAEPARPWSIAAMAAEMHMSQRSFLRRFHEATGATPGAWLMRERVELARALLEGGATRIEDLAQRAGFPSAHALRHHFRRELGLSPSEYRANLRREAG